MLDLQKLVNIAHRAAHAFDIPNNFHIEFVDQIRDCDTKELTRHHGLIELESRLIWIRIKQLRNKKQELCLSTVLDSIAHELAHIHEQEHADNHKKLTAALLVWMGRNWI